MNLQMLVDCFRPKQSRNNTCRTGTACKRGTTRHDPPRVALWSLGASLRTVHVSECRSMAQVWEPATPRMRMCFCIFVVCLQRLVNVGQIFRHVNLLSSSSFSMKSKEIARTMLKKNTQRMKLNFPSLPLPRLALVACLHGAGGQRVGGPSGGFSRRNTA